MLTRKPLRIVVYPHSLSVGGSQINAIELAAAVRDLGHEVTVFAAETGPLADTVATLKLPLVLAPEWRRRPSLRIIRALRELCRQERIDIVHGYEWPPCVEAFYGPMCLDGVMVGCTVMSMAVAPFIPPSVPLVVGTEQIAAAARVGRSGRVDVIEPPVDTRSNHPGISGAEFRAEWNLGNRPTVVLVSRLAIALKLEGIERAIAASALLAADTGLRLVIVGDGQARDKVAALANAVNAKTGEPTVVLTGELADPRQAYAAADVVLAMGGSALRAMAFEKPVIVLGELGFAKTLTPESASTFLWQGFYGLGDGDARPEGLAGLIAPLLADIGRRAALGAFSKEFVTSRFSLAAAAKRQVDLYIRWVSARPGRPTLLAEATLATSKLFVHKVGRRSDRIFRRTVSEDFNTVAQIAKTASLAANASGPAAAKADRSARHR